MSRDDTGRWRRGCESPNPGGRPKGRIREFRALCMQVAPDLVDILLSIARDEHAKARDRISACEVVLNRAFGKPRADDEEADDPIGRQERVIALVSPELRSHLLPQNDANGPKVLTLTTSEQTTAVRLAPS